MERRKRRWYTRGITWLSLIAISGALLSGLFQLAVAVAPGYRQALAESASAALGQPVQVDKLALRWRWLWPLLELDGVRLLQAGTAAPVMAVNRIRLGFAVSELLQGRLIPAEIEVDGATLALEITPAGELRLKGRNADQPPPSFAEIARQLKQFSRLRASSLALQVDDLRPDGADFALQVQRGDLRLDEQGFELRSEINAAEVVASRLRLRIGMQGDLAEPAGWEGRWTLDASGIQAAAPLIRLLPALARVQATDATLTAAGDWQQGAMGASELALRAQMLTLQGKAASSLRAVDLGVHYRPTVEGGVVDLVPLRLIGHKGPWPTSSARLEWRQSRDQPRSWRGSSDFLRLDDLAPWAAALLPRPEAGETAALASVKGDISALEGRWQPDAQATSRFNLRAQGKDMGLHWPGRGALQGLSGELSADENGGRASLQAQPLSFELSKVFSGTQRAQRMQADLQWQRDGTGWRLNVPRFGWSLLGSVGQATAELHLPAEASEKRLKLAAQFDVADAAALKPLMPLHWGQSLKDWLDRAIVRGRIDKAVLDIDGPLADFPFHKKPTGQWSLKLPLSGARLEYHPDWPGVDQLVANLRLTGNGLRFEARRGVISGVIVTNASGQIADFATEPLLLDATTVGEAPYYYRFLRGSPLAQRLKSLLSRSEVEGPAAADVHLQIPLHSKPEQKSVVSGEVRLQGNTLRHAALDRPVQDIAGTLRFGPGPGLTSDDLQGRFHDQAVSARITANAEGSDVLTATARVDFDAEAGVAAHYVPGWLRPYLKGSADWQLSIPLAGADSGHLQLSSSLIGARSLLPQPFAKTEAAALPVRLDLGGDELTPLAITGDVAGQLGLALRFARRNAALELRGVALRLGPGAMPAQTTADGWRLAGSADVFEPAQWRGVIAAIRDSSGAGRASAELPFLGAELAVQRLRLAGYDAPDVRLEARREYGGYALSLQGEGSLGSLKLNSGGDALSGRFARLNLLAAPKGGEARTGVTDAPTDPTTAPTLDLAVDALRIGNRDFGALAVATERSPKGQRLRRLTLEGGIARLSAEGEWRRAKGLTEAESHFVLTSDDLAGALEGLGFAQTVSGRAARIEGTLTWPAATGGFDWAQGRGTVSLSAEDGALRTVDPGSGSRVLGLLNFYALPRRFALDFGDVVSEGLGFDRIDGSFQLANGIAHTDDLTVRGPSVRLEVRGNIGLAAHDYDQIITVTPNTKGITLGALLLGGASAVAAPVLPVIAVIASQVIDKPLGQVTQLRYGLAGSWENPEIRKIDSDSTPSPEPSPP